MTHPSSQDATDSATPARKGQFHDEAIRKIPGAEQASEHFEPFEFPAKKRGGYAPSAHAKGGEKEGGISPALEVATRHAQNEAK